MTDREPSEGRRALVEDRSTSERRSARIVPVDGPKRFVGRVVTDGVGGPPGSTRKVSGVGRGRDGGRVAVVRWNGGGYTAQQIRSVAGGTVGDRRMILWGALVQCSRRSRSLLPFGRRDSRCRSRSNGPNRSSRPSRSDRPNRPDRASLCSLAEFCGASYERGTSEHPELIFHRRLRSAVDMTTDTTRTLAECEGCGFPYVVRRTNEGSSYPVGVNECSQCGGTTFTTVDGDALRTGVSPRSGES